MVVEIAAEEDVLRVMDNVGAAQAHVDIVEAVTVVLLLAKVTVKEDVMDHVLLALAVLDAEALVLVIAQDVVVVTPLVLVAAVVQELVQDVVDVMVVQEAVQEAARLDVQVLAQELV